MTCSLRAWRTAFSATHPERSEGSAVFSTSNKGWVPHSSPVFGLEWDNGTLSLTPQTQPVSLVRETHRQQQHTQDKKTKHAVPLALVTDAVQENHPDTKRE